MDIFYEALKYLVEFDIKLYEIILLSLFVSISAAILSSIIAIIITCFLVLKRFVGKNATLLIINSMMSVPPVVVGLILYLLFSNTGILGSTDMLYSYQLMIIAQFLIVLPIIISLSFTVLNNKYMYLYDYLMSLNTSDFKILKTILHESRNELLIIFMTGLGRALSEVGAVIIVGGNIAHMTRVMTTSIVLETSRGELATALSLGIALILIAILINMFIFIIKNRYNKKL